MRLLTYIVCLIFTFVSLGGNIYIHQCKDAVLLSLYDKVNTQSCPFCEEHHKSHDEKEAHCAGECKDSVLQIDNLTDKNFNTTPTFFTQITPAIIPLLWIVNFTRSSEEILQQTPVAFLYSATDSSPPIYLQNCIFRI